MTADEVRGHELRLLDPLVVGRCEGPCGQQSIGMLETVRGVVVSVPLTRIFWSRKLPRSSKLQYEQELNMR
jgi:hypothetical protein